MTSQSSIWKSMSLEEKYRLTASTIRQSRHLKRLGLQLSHPNAPPEEIEKKLARIWLHARP